MLNKFVHIRSAQEYTYDTQVIMKYCYISMLEVENGELIQKLSFSGSVGLNELCNIVCIIITWYLKQS